MIALYRDGGGTGARRSRAGRGARAGVLRAGDARRGRRSVREGRGARARLARGSRAPALSSSVAGRPRRRSRNTAARFSSGTRSTGRIGAGCGARGPMWQDRCARASLEHAASRSRVAAAPCSRASPWPRSTSSFPPSARSARPSWAMDGAIRCVDAAGARSPDSDRRGAACAAPRRRPRIPRAPSLGQSVPHARPARPRRRLRLRPIGGRLRRTLREALHAFKFSGKRALARPSPSSWRSSASRAAGRHRGGGAGAPGRRPGARARLQSGRPPGPEDRERTGDPDPGALARPRARHPAPERAAGHAPAGPTFVAPFGPRAESRAATSCSSTTSSRPARRSANAPDIARRRGPGAWGALTVARVLHAAV